MPGYIHGQTDPREVERLERQARFAAPFSLRDFDAAPGMRVLDLATGVGAMGGEIQARFPGIRLHALDLDLAPLRAARRRRPGLSALRGDGRRLPFGDGAFDRVHASWMLEHVPDPAGVLREVRRALRPGGYCHFIEVDNSTFETSPGIREVTEAMAALNEAQLRGGGDPYIGRRLGEMLEEAGFSRVEARPVDLHGSQANPAFYRGLTEEFAEIFESLDEVLGPSMAPRLHAAAARLRALESIPGSSMRYRAFLGQGWR